MITRAMEPQPGQRAWLNGVPTHTRLKEGTEVTVLEVISRRNVLIRAPAGTEEELPKCGLNTGLLFEGKSGNWVPESEIPGCWSTSPGKSGRCSGKVGGRRLTG